MLNFPGEKVERTGAYTVRHRGHRSTHECVLREGEFFPHCRKCGGVVTFEFAKSLSDSDALEHAGYDRDFMDAVLGTRRPAAA